MESAATRTPMHAHFTEFLKNTNHRNALITIGIVSMVIVAASSPCCAQRPDQLSSVFQDLPSCGTLCAASHLSSRAAPFGCILQSDTGSGSCLPLTPLASWHELSDGSPHRNSETLHVLRHRSWHVLAGGCTCVVFVAGMSDGAMTSPLYLMMKP